MKKRIMALSALLLGVTSMVILTACAGQPTDVARTQEIANQLQSNQATPTDITYSLQRYNLIKRSYWINGQYDKAKSLHCDVEKNPGYVYLYSGNTLVTSYVVDGQVTSLRTYLTPDSEKYSSTSYSIEWLADVDGTYGENPDGIFFFTKDGTYVEWTGTYLYSTTPITSITE